MWSLRIETARIKNLSAECREAGVDYEGLPTGLRAVRTLVEQRRFEEALAQMRELRLELLARLMLQEPMPLPPIAIENPPARTLPPTSVLDAVNRKRPETPAHAKAIAPR